jgi:hypothetical protein
MTKHESKSLSAGDRVQWTEFSELSPDYGTVQDASDNHIEVLWDGFDCPQHLDRTDSDLEYLELV